MKTILLIISVLLVPLVLFSQGIGWRDGDIAVLQWSETPLHNSIRENIMGGLPVEVDLYQLKGEVEKLDEIFNQISTGNYRLVIIIGAEIITPVLKYLNNVPTIILSSSVRLNKIHDKFPNITGVYSFTSPESQYNIINATIKDIKKIGIVYNPLYSRTQVEMFESTIKDTTVKTVKYGISSAKEIPTALHFIGDIHLLWLSTDPIYLDRDAIKHIIEYSNEKKVPVFSSYREIVKRGALIGLSTSAISLEILSIIASLSKGKNISDISPRFPSESLLLNEKTAELLGIELPSELLLSAEEVYR